MLWCQICILKKEKTDHLGVNSMKNLGTGMRIFIAIITFLMFGFIALLIDGFDYLGIVNTGLLGVIVTFIVFD